MNGYVMNMSLGWVHIMKRNVGPGKKIPLSELYKQYGEKHGIKKGPEFIEWLRAVKLRNEEIWKIVLTEDEKKSAKDIVSDLPSGTPLPVENADMPSDMSKLSVKDVVMLSVRKGREALPKINDLKLLKYAFQEANQLSGKDSLCNIIRKRIKDLELGR